MVGPCSGQGFEREWMRYTVTSTNRIAGIIIDQIKKGERVKLSDEIFEKSPVQHLPRSVRGGGGIGGARNRVDRSRRGS